MALRQVDVMNKAGAILRTYPITLGAETLPRASDFEKAALTQASATKLVPAGDVSDLRARMQPRVVAPKRAAAQPVAAAQPGAPGKT